MKEATKKEIEDLKKARIEGLDNIISLIERTTNNLWSPNERMWNKLLTMRDNLLVEHDKLQNT